MREPTPLFRRHLAHERPLNRGPEQIRVEKNVRDRDREKRRKPRMHPRGRLPPEVRPIGGVREIGGRYYGFAASSGGTKALHLIGGVRKIGGKYYGF